MQKKIESAKSRVSEAASDESKVPDARTAISAAVMVVDPEYGQDRVARLVYKLTQADGVKRFMQRKFADAAKGKIDKLAAKVQSAYDLAHSIKATDATTWDNVKALGRLVGDWGGQKSRPVYGYFADQELRNEDGWRQEGSSVK